LVRNIEITTNEIFDLGATDLEFKEKLFKLPDIDIKSLKYCFQCTTCTASCPISYAFDLMPHQIMQMISLSLINKVINCNAIWLCLTCYICQERCPQNVKITDIFFGLKNIATSHGLYPKSIKLFTAAIYENGRAIEVTDFQEEEREDLGLPEVSPFDKNAIKKIFNKIGIMKLFKSNDKGD